jgi:hypothetical protein
MPTYNKIENMEESLNLGYEKINIKNHITVTEI